MPRDKTANHIRIMAAAREEFMEYGFENASMRRIGERVGMTAAGIYRHCRDKEDLFDQLVAPAVERMNAWLDAHTTRSVSAVREGGNLWQDTEIDMMRDLIYPNMADYRLLLSKAQGTKYENFLHDLVEDHQQLMQEFLPDLKARGYAVRDISPKELHLLLTAYTTAMFEPVIHDYPMEDALKCLEMVEAFFMPGWKQIMGF
ncbi:MAG: TetR/AcrR family transcriptional regulator [Oscillospiraceae bacterium]|nr:TetR/AcrR family transcriptional regulator [Oscillospiraceae bacterium]